MKAINFLMIIIGTVHISTLFGMEQKSVDKQSINTFNPQLSIDLTGTLLPNLTIPQPSYTNCYNLVEGNASLLKSLIAQEQAGKYCAELCAAENELHKGLRCGESEILFKQYDMKTIYLVLSVTEKSTQREALITAIDVDNETDMRIIVKLNRYAANAYGSSAPYNDRTITPLHYVLCRIAENKDYKSTGMHILLEAGANCNAIDDAGNTPMHHASSVDHILLLWEFGANNNIQNELGQTPLINHIRLHNWDIVRCLIDGGADLNIQDNEGNSALHEAAKQNALEIVDLLLRKGADYNISNKKGMKPIDEAHKNLPIKTHIQWFLHLSLCHALEKDDSDKVWSLMRNNDITDAEKILEWARKFHPKNIKSINLLAQDLCTFNISIKR